MEETILQTERLRLRRFQDSDLQDLYEYLSDEEVVRYEPYKPMSLEETKDNLAWRVSTDEMIAVELKEKHKLIGNVYFWKDEQGNPIWKDSYVYAALQGDVEN